MLHVTIRVWAEQCDVKSNFLNQHVTAKIYRTVLLVHTNIIMKLM